MTNDPAVPTPQAQVEKLVAAIADWAADNQQGYDVAIELLCRLIDAAEEALRDLLAAHAALRAERDELKEVAEFEQGEAVKYEEQANRLEAECARLRAALEQIVEYPVNFGIGVARAALAASPTGAAPQPCPNTVLIDELISIACWIRTPGNINRDDAVDECARVLENRAAALRKELK